MSVRYGYRFYTIEGGVYAVNYDGENQDEFDCLINAKLKLYRLEGDFSFASFPLIVIVLS